MVLRDHLRHGAAIVRFLDHADRRIRRYILAKQKLIELLEEQKQAIIHRAVTRGSTPTSGWFGLSHTAGICEDEVSNHAELASTA